MAKFRCSDPDCTESFNTDRGRGLHFLRKHTAAGKNWGSTAGQSVKRPTKQKRPAQSGSVKDKLRRVLADHPEGLQVKHIIAGMKRIGYRPSGNASGYVSQAATSDPNIIRVQRGIYRLKDSALNELRTQTEAPTDTLVAEAPLEIADMPQEALLVRIDHQDKLNRALGNLVAAHTVFIREITHD